MVIAAYCRVSTDSEEQQSSLSNQQSFFEREVKQAGHTLYRVYADEGLTGTKLNNRPQFNEMLTDAGIDVRDVVVESDKRRIRRTMYIVSSREPLFREIWIKNTSRFARNTMSYEIIVALRQKKVNVHFLDNNINTMDLQQDFLLKLFQVFDENDSKDKSAKVRFGLKEIAKQGKIWSNTKFFGYKYDIANNRLIAIPEEAETVKRIFELYSQGYGLYRLRKILNEEHRYSRSGKPFGQTTVRRMLGNEKYAGLNNILKNEAGTVLVDQHYSKPRKEYEVTETDRIEPIVSKELFYRCQELLRGKVNYKINVGIYFGISKYAGLLYCSKCGSVYYANSRQNANETRSVYNCSGKKTRRNNCNCANVFSDDVDKFIQELVDGKYTEYMIAQAYSAMSIVLSQIEDDINLLDMDRAKEAEEISAEIEKLNQQMSGYMDLYAIIPAQREMLQEKMQILSKEIEKLKENKSNMSASNDMLLNDMKKCIVAYDSLTDVIGKMKDIKVDTEIVLQSLDKIYVSGEVVHHRSYPKLTPRFKMSKDVYDAIGHDVNTMSLRVAKHFNANETLKTIEKARELVRSE